jgi:pimeloyl-ACP methyl ester carboxylesterase
MPREWVKSRATWSALAICAGLFSNAVAAEVSYKFIDVDGIKIFYREAGDPRKPTILLLHGFPSLSHMFRDLVPALDERFHVVAPDYPGMGNSEAPPADIFKVSFDSVADVIEKFVRDIRVSNVILYMQDFGGRVGMRLATKHPEWVRGIVIQNTPVSLDGWEPSRLKAIQGSTGPETPEKRAGAAEVRHYNTEDSCFSGSRYRALAKKLLSRWDPRWSGFILSCSATKSWTRSLILRCSGSLADS